MVISYALSTLLYQETKMTGPAFRVDVHHHILPKEYLDALSGIGVVAGLGMNFPEWKIDKTLDFMDNCGIATAMVSISDPVIYFGDISFTRDLSRRMNELIAELIQKYPGRFGSFASLPLPDVDAAISELNYAMDILKLDGVGLLSNIDSTYLGDAKFDRLFQELNTRKSIIYIHPSTIPGWNTARLALPPFLVDAPHDTTRAVTNLLYSGTFERYPDITYILAHAGGTVPYLVSRILLGEQYRDFSDFVKQIAPKGMINYLKNLYYDTALSASPHCLRSLQELADNSHILFGSDYCFAPDYIAASGIKGLKEYFGSSSDTLKAIELDNAMKLFPRLSKNAFS
jgi:predicted TIM-barrel fold metal-dependent hydrolase